MLIEVVQEFGQERGPGAVLAPFVEAVVDGLPGTIAFGDVAPRGARVQDPEDAVEGAVVGQPRVSPATVVPGVGQQGSKSLPLPGAEFVTSSHNQPPRGYQSQGGQKLCGKTYARQSLAAERKSTHIACRVRQRFGEWFEIMT